MGYLNEDGLATLVGKVKGQMVQLTSEQYRNLPSTKNTDNKIYFVEDEDYARAIDNEPTLNSNNFVKSGGVYTYTSKIGTGSLTTTAKTLIPAVNELKASVDTLNNELSNFTLQTSVLTPVKTMTVGSQNRVSKYGRIVFGTIIFSTETTSSQNTVMFRTPYPLRYPTVIIIRADGGKTYLMGTTTENSDELTALYGDGIPAGVYRASFTYLTTL